jgi:hypothetical protein
MEGSEVEQGPGLDRSSGLVLMARQVHVNQVMGLQLDPGGVEKSIHYGFESKVSLGTEEVLIFGWEVGDVCADMSVRLQEALKGLSKVRVHVLMVKGGEERRHEA